MAVKPDTSGEQLWSALVFGSPAMYELNEQEQMTLAMKGRAVSPVTSYLAIEPGVRPSTEGLDRSAGSHFAKAPKVRMGFSQVSNRAPYLDQEAFLTERLWPEVERCGGTADDATVDLETTVDEVVAVQLNGRSNGIDPPIVACFTEAA